MTKHTPGPWFTWKDGIYSGVPKEMTKTMLRGFNSQICSMEDFDGKPQREKKANARLIAAAPDLLEACQTFAEWVRREEEGFVAAGRSRDTPEGEKEWREWFYGNIALCDLAQEQARAAIAKATGGQQ